MRIENVTTITIVLNELGEECAERCRRFRVTDLQRNAKSASLRYLDNSVTNV
jgi:hypothetical protein